MLHYDLKKSENEITIIFNGKIKDQVGIETFQKAFDETLEQKPERVVIDFEKLEFINSAGIGLLIKFYRSFSSHDESENAFRITRVPDDVYILLQRLRIDKIVSVEHL